MLTAVSKDPGLVVIEAPSDANVWKVSATVGQRLRARQSLVTLEAMKMEVEVVVPDHLDGATVELITVVPGIVVESGRVLAYIRPVENGRARELRSGLGDGQGDGEQGLEGGNGWVGRS